MLSNGISALAFKSASCESEVAQGEVTCSTH